MRILLAITALVLISSCKQIPIYTEHTLFGGYKDVETDKENHCKAKFFSAIDYEKKVDYGYLRVLHVCKQKGYKYFELVGIEKQREGTVDQYSKTITYTPIVEIAAYNTPAEGRVSIKFFAEEIKARYNMAEPVF